MNKNALFCLKTHCNDLFMVEIQVQYTQYIAFMLKYFSSRGTYFSIKN